MTIQEFVFEMRCRIWNMIIFLIKIFTHQKIMSFPSLSISFVYFLFVLYRVVTEFLKQDPFSVVIENEACNTPLHLAATEGHFKCCKALLEHGEGVDFRSVDSLLTLQFEAERKGAFVD